MFVYLHYRNLSILWQVNMCLQYLTQERGILPVPTSLSPSDSYVLMEQMSHSYWFLIGNLFCNVTTKRQWRRHAIPKQAFFPQLIPTPAPMMVSKESVLLTCVQAENGTTLSLVTASIGFGMEGFPPRFTTTNRMEHENPGVSEGSDGEGGRRGDQDGEYM